MRINPTSDGSLIPQSGGTRRGESSESAASSGSEQQKSAVQLQQINRLLQQMKSHPEVREDLVKKAKRKMSGKKLLTDDNIAAAAMELVKDLDELADSLAAMHEGE